MRGLIGQNRLLMLVLLSFAFFGISFANEPLKDYLFTAAISYHPAGYANSIFFANSIPIEQVRSIAKSQINERSIESISLQLLTENNGLGLDSKTLQLQSLKNDRPPGITSSGYFYVFFEQQYENVPVYGSEVKFLYIDDKLASMKAIYYPKIGVNTDPKIKEKNAIKIAKKAVDENNKDDEAIYSLKLAIIPNSNDGADSTLVWIVDITSDSDADAYRIIIDAQNGRVLEKISQEAHATISGNVSGMIWPHDPNNGPAIEVPFKDLNVSVVNRTTPTQSFGFATSDSNGAYAITYNYPQSQALLYSTLSYMTGFNQNFRSPWAVVILPNSQIRTSHNYTVPSDPSFHNWIWNDLSYPYRDRYQEPNVFYHLGKVHDYYVRGFDPFNLTEMNFKVFGRLNWFVGCNAGASFQTPYIEYGNTSACNTALYSDVTYHEYGHILIGKSLYNDTGWIDPGDSWGITEGRSMDEALGDYFATSINNESRVNPTARNLSNTKRFPVDYNFTYTDPSGPQMYQNSLIFSGAKWDLRTNFQSYGNSGNDFTNNGTLRADAIILQTYKFRPRNYTQFFNTLLDVARGEAYQGNGDIYASPDREAICDALNFKHSLLPDIVPPSYCARMGTLVNPATYLLNDEIYANGTGFAPRTSADAYISAHVEGRTDNSPIIPLPGTIPVTVSIDVYGNLPYTYLWIAIIEGQFDIIADTNQDGNYTIGLDSISTFTVSVPDTQAPSVELMAPINTFYPNTSVEVEISFDDPNIDSVWYELNGENHTFGPGRQLIEGVREGENTIVAYANDTAGNINETPTVTFNALNCSLILDDAPPISVNSSQQHFLSIFQVTPNEFPLWQDESACAKFYLTNTEDISQMKLRRLLIDDEGYVFVNGKYVRHWEDHPSAPLSEDIDLDVSGNASLLAGETTEIMLYAIDRHNVVYGGTVQVQTGNGLCIENGDLAPMGQPTACCSGIQQPDGLCAPKPDGAYCEEWSAIYCADQTCGSRVCGGIPGAPGGDEGGGENPHNGDTIENGGETLPAGGG